MRGGTKCRCYIRSEAAGYIAAARRLCPPFGRVMFCRRRRQSLGVTAVRSHFYSWTHSDSVSLAVTAVHTAIKMCAHGAHTFVFHAPKGRRRRASCAEGALHLLSTAQYFSLITLESSDPPEYPWQIAAARASAVSSGFGTASRRRVSLTII